MTSLLERPRRLRRTEAIRQLVRETRLAPSDFALPLFAVPGEGRRVPIASMEGVYQTSVDELVKDARAAFDVGVRSVLLFGVPATKDAVGSSGWDDSGPVVQAVRAVVEHLSPHRATDRRQAWARLAHVLQPSPERVAPACPAYGACGGCPLQHWAYEAQVRWTGERCSAL